MTPFSRFTQVYQGKNVLVLGLGVLGGASKSTITFLKAGSHVRVADIKSQTDLQSSVDILKSYPVQFVFGPHRQEDIDWAQVIVRNPSIPWHHPILEYARSQGKDIVMDAQLFIEYCGLKTIGITGTRGKSTTTLMVHAMVKSGYPGTVYLGGNLAHQPLLPLLELIDGNEDSVAILELSSWQLQAFATKKISVNFACVTNLYPDHLNTYKNVTEYYQDKTNIFKYQTKSDHLCLLKKQPEFSSWADQAAGRVHLFDESILPPGVTLKVPGLHNRRNAAAAFCLATCFGIPASVCVDSLNNFEGVPYRLQTVAIKNQITFVNDTTATTPVATITALTTLSSPLIAIIGGHDKNLPLEELAHTLNQKAEACVLLKGSGTQRLKKLLNPQKILLETNNFKAAVLAATGAAKTGETVLLSPAFASFGMFKNEFDRGQQFNEIVTNL